MYAEPMALDELFYQIFTDQTFGASKINKTTDDDMFGVEIELEGQNIQNCVTDPTFTKFWINHVENSLKILNPGDQAIEYVFKKPFNYSDTEKAITVLAEHMAKPGVKVHNSGRGSVHVHINVSNEKMSTVYNYLTLAVIFDELFVSQNGVTRIGNNFCLRAKDAEGFIVSLTESIRNYGTFAGLKPDNRYSSINVMSLFKFGTIEFRSLECTVDKNRILNWVKTLQALKVAARNFSNPLEIISQFSLNGPERFFLNILGPQALNYMHVYNRHRMLFDGIRLCQEFANCSAWIVAKSVSEQPPTKSKYGIKKLKPSSYYLDLATQAPQAGGGGGWNAFHAAYPMPTVSEPTEFNEDEDEDE